MSLPRWCVDDISECLQELLGMRIRFTEVLLEATKNEVFFIWSVFDVLEQADKEDIPMPQDEARYILQEEYTICEAGDYHMTLESLHDAVVEWWDIVKEQAEEDRYDRDDRLQ